MVFGFFGRNRPTFSDKVKSELYADQKGICNGCKRRLEMRDMAVDHKNAFAKGGSDKKRNLQLLCTSCNSIKGAGTMAQLKAKLVEKDLIKPTVKAASKPKATAKAKTTVKAASKPKATAKAKTTMKAASKPKATAKAKTTVKAASKPKAAVKVKTTAKAASKPKTAVKVKATAKAASKPKTTVKAKAVAKPKTARKPAAKKPAARRPRNPLAGFW